MISKILLIPYWVFEVFTTTKSFRTNPIIGNTTLNRLGLHIARLVISHWITNIRWIMLTPLLSKEERKKFHEQGYLLIENFLPQAEYDQIKKEVVNYQGEIRECIQGDTLTLYSLLDQSELSQTPHIAKMLSNKSLLNRLMYGSSKLKHPLFFINCIKNRYVEGALDPQKNLHSDTFHPTVKAWIFFENVTPQNGPFCYVPGSHKLTWKRLKWEYKNSIKGKDLAIRYAQNGSLRVDQESLNALGFPPPKSFEIPENSFIMANTHGFHCRGLAERSSRMSIYAYSRSNPFNPFLGIGSKFLNKFDYYMTKKYWQHEDKKAEQRGVLSTWHLVPNEKLRS